MERSARGDVDYRGPISPDPGIEIFRGGITLDRP